MGGRAAGPRQGRRAVLGLGLLAVASLGGCGVRLEEGAPELPWVPRRTRMDGEDLLVELLWQTSALVTMTSASSDPVASALAGLHRHQAEVIRDALLRGGVPEEVIAPPSPSPTLPADLPAAEAAAAQDPVRYAVLAPDVARPVLALVGQRLAAAALLRGGEATVTTPTPTPTPTASGSSGAVTTATALPGLDGVLTAGLEAAHWLEVAQARAPRDDDPARERERIAQTEAWLAQRVAAWKQALGPDLPEAPVAIPLPFAVDSAATRTQLVAHGLTRVRAALGRLVDALPAEQVAAALLVVPAELADVEVHLHAWGGELQAFPGLS